MLQAGRRVRTGRRPGFQRKARGSSDPHTGQRSTFFPGGAWVLGGHPAACSCAQTQQRGVQGPMGCPPTPSPSLPAQHALRTPAPSDACHPPAASTSPNLSAVLYVCPSRRLETALRADPSAFSFFPKHKTDQTSSTLTFGPRPALVWGSPLTTTKDGQLTAAVWLWPSECQNSGGNSPWGMPPFLGHQVEAGGE